MNLNAKAGSFISQKFTTRRWAPLLLQRLVAIKIIIAAIEAHKVSNGTKRRLQQANLNMFTLRFTMVLSIDVEPFHHVHIKHHTGPVHNNVEVSNSGSIFTRSIYVIMWDETDECDFVFQFEQGCFEQFTDIE